MSNRPGYVAWEKVCRPKNQGGLGIRDVILWNKAAIANHIWAIAHKKDNLLVRWVHFVYIKDDNQEGYKASPNASWI